MGRNIEPIVEEEAARQAYLRFDFEQHRSQRERVNWEHLPKAERDRWRAMVDGSIEQAA
jgi:hypothetical protein